mmetsp:Transcript_16695/g.33448  ORF Transcript_16695/g.33448 Transcript_16695/m.33448 type:complete len:220 (-) Transcript_16695:144-803(-)
MVGGKEVWRHPPSHLESGRADLLQQLDDLAEGLGAVVGILGPAAHDEVSDVAVDGVGPPHVGSDLLLEDGHDQVALVVDGELRVRHLAVVDLVDEYGVGEYVAALVVGACPGLHEVSHHLRGHPEHGPHGRGVGLGVRRHPEVRHLGRVPLGQEHVQTLDVSVHVSELVESVQALGALHRQPPGGGLGEHAALLLVQVENAALWTHLGEQDRPAQRVHR